MSRTTADTVPLLAFVVALFGAIRAKSHAAFWALMEAIGLDGRVEFKARHMAGGLHAMRTDRGTWATDRGQLGFQTLVAAFIVVITGMAVVLVLDKFDASLGTPSNNDLSNSSANLLSGFSSMVDLIEPLLLIAIVVVLIALVRRVG